MEAVLAVMVTRDHIRELTKVPIFYSEETFQLTRVVSELRRNRRNNAENENWLLWQHFLKIRKSKFKWHASTAIAEPNAENRVKIRQ